jgi:hypothetical protein
LAFLCLHFGYGIGYLKGLIHLLFSLKSDQKTNANLSR